LDIYWNILTMHVPINVKTPNNFSKWQMGFNSAFKGLKYFRQTCTEGLNTNFIFNNYFFENLAIYEVMWKNNLDPDRPQRRVRCIRIACWIPMATKTCLKYVTLTAPPLPQWLYKRTSLLRYSYVRCLVIVKILVLFYQHR
jgi:hypothetical protein